MTEKLLREYVGTGSESAFRELVERYVNLVYSTAYRRLAGDAHLAEDAVQTVFSDFARKAPTLPSNVMLGGWLHRHTCFVTGAMLRSNRRRQTREREAMELFDSSTDDNWKAVAPVLDEVVNQLAPADRDAVILRFFEGLDFRTIGERIGSNEDAAQKRVSRALEKLRVLLEQRGATFSIAALATALGAGSIISAPAGLAARVAAKAVAQSTAGFGLLAMLLALFTPAKIALVAAAIALLGAAVWKQNSSVPNTTLAPANVEIVTLASTEVDNSAAAPSTARETTAPPQTNVLRLTILAADSGKPVPNVRISYNIWTPTGSRHQNQTLTARRDGICDVPLPPPDATHIMLTTQVDDFASTRLEWHPARGDVIPDSYTLRLQRPVVIGGRVVGPDGQAVADAEVLFSHREDPAKKLPESHEFGTVPVTTDSDGRWEIRRIAPEMIRRLHGFARHTNYVHSGFIFVDRMSDTEEQLRKGTYVFTLREAVVVRGTVTDQHGYAINGAEVFMGGDSNARRQVTGPDGTFALAGCKPGTNLLTAEAKGYASTTIEIEAKRDVGSFAIVLAPEKPLRVRVVDQAGAPVKGATLTFHNDRDLRTGARKGAPIQTFFRPKTDHNGIAIWEGAPDVELTCSVSAPDHMLANDIKLRPDGTEHVVVLLNSVTVSGTVRDDENGKPIPRFRIICGWPEYGWEGEHRVTWSGSPDEWLRFSGGTFKHTFRDSLVYGTTNRGYVLRVEADGYASFITRVVQPDERHAKFDIKLRRSASDWITVLLPDGRAGADVDVGLITLSASLRLTPHGFSREHSYDRSALITTDVKGRFSTTRNEELWQIIAVHPLGYAEASPAQLRDAAVLRLQPWGRLEGVLTRNGRPVAAEELLLNLADIDSRGVSLDHSAFRTSTDASGRFKFEKVPPTRVRLSRIEKSPSGVSTFFALESVNVAPAETKTLNLHARDRTLALQLLWPEGLRPDPQSHTEVMLQAPLADISPDGALHMGKVRVHHLNPMQDGSYWVKDLLPGSYRLQVRVLNQSAPGGLKASGTATVVVPQDAETVEIGDLHLSRPAQAGN